MESTKKMLLEINEFTKQWNPTLVHNPWKLIVFLHNNNELSKNSNLEKMHLKADKNMKYLGVNLAKSVQDLKSKPQNMLKEIKYICK